MEIDQLSAFVALAKNKSFSRTAEELHLVQSSISTRIQVLEDHVGRPLFERTNRRVELTPAGRLFLPYAERILALTKEAKTAIRGQGVFEDQITLGSTDSMWRHLLRPVLLDYCSLYPMTKVETRTGHSHQVVQLLIDGVVQLAIVYYAPSIPGMVVRSFFEDEVILVAGKGTWFSKKKMLTKQDIAELPIINIQWDGPLDAMIKKLLPKDFLPQIQLDQLSMLTVFVAAGRGVAFVPRRNVKRSLETGELVELTLAKEIRLPRRHGYAIYRREKQVRPVIQRWLKLLGEHGYRVK